MFSCKCWFISRPISNREHLQNKYPSFKVNFKLHIGYKRNIGTIWKISNWAYAYPYVHLLLMPNKDPADLFSLLYFRLLFRSTNQKCISILFSEVAVSWSWFIIKIKKNAFVYKVLVLIMWNKGRYYEKWIMHLRTQKNLPSTFSSTSCTFHSIINNDIVKS